MSRNFGSFKTVILYSVGVLREMMNHGPDAGREVVVDFPEHSGWKSILNDLEVVPAEPLRVIIVSHLISEIFHQV